MHQRFRLRNKQQTSKDMTKLPSNHMKGGKEIPVSPMSSSATTQSMKFSPGPLVNNNNQPQTNFPTNGPLILPNSQGVGGNQPNLTLSTSSSTKYRISIKQPEEWKIKSIAKYKYEQQIKKQYLQQIQQLQLQQQQNLQQQLQGTENGGGAGGEKKKSSKKKNNSNNTTGPFPAVPSATSVISSTTTTTVPSASSSIATTNESVQQQQQQQHKLQQEVDAVYETNVRELANYHFNSTVIKNRIAALHTVRSSLLWLLKKTALHERGLINDHLTVPPPSNAKE